MEDRFGIFLSPSEKNFDVYLNEEILLQKAKWITREGEKRKP